MGEELPGISGSSELNFAVFRFLARIMLSSSIEGG